MSVLWMATNDIVAAGAYAGSSGEFDLCWASQPNGITIVEDEGELWMQLTSTNVLGMRPQSYNVGNQDDVVVGLRIRRGDTASGSDYPQFTVRGPDGDMFSLRITSGQLYACEAYDGTIRATTTLAPLTNEDDRAYVEVRWKRDTGGSNGLVEIWVDGAKDAETTGLTWSRRGSHVDFAYGDVNTDDVFATGWRQKDWYLGTTVQGPKQIRASFPSSSVASGWSPSAGSNHETVDEVGAGDGDTTYNDAASAGLVDVFGHEITKANALQVVTRAKVATAALGVFDYGIKSGSSEAVDTEAPTGSYAIARGTVANVDPATAVAWTPAGVVASRILLRSY